MHQKIKLKYSLSVKTEENIQTSEMTKNWEIRRQKKVRKKLRNLFSQVCAVNTVALATQLLMEKHLNSHLKDLM